MNQLPRRLADFAGRVAAAFGFAQGNWMFALAQVAATGNVIPLAGVGDVDRRLFGLRGANWVSSSCRWFGL